MEKVPGGEAAVLAAFGAGLLAVLRLVDLLLLGGGETVGVAVTFAATVLPAAASCGFFAMLRRRQRVAAAVALALAILPQAVFAIASVPGRGWGGSAVPGLLTLCWAIFLVVLVSGRGIARLAILALPLLILTALQSLGDLLTVVTSFNELVTGSLALFWRYSPLRTLWHQVATPAVLLLYWVSQMRFLLAVRADE